MQLYIYVASDDLDELVEPVSEVLIQWIGDANERKQLVNLPEEDRLGVNISIESKNQLNKPLKFLYSLAKDHKCDFVIGKFDGGSLGEGAMEDVCYFGYEEGRPDMFEVASYLEL
mgnify:FL=1